MKDLRPPHAEELDRPPHGAEPHWERYVAPVAAATFLSLDQRTILRWAREGKLPAHPLGKGARKTWRFKLSELDTWMSQAVTSGSTAARRPCHERGVD